VCLVLCSSSISKFLNIVLNVKIGEGIRRLGNFINNEYYPPASGDYIKNKSPATDRVNALIPLSNSQDVDKG